MAINLNNSNEVISIKEEVIDLNYVSTESLSTDMLGFVESAFKTLKKEAACEITAVSISSTEMGTVKYEVLPPESNEHSSVETNDKSVIRNEETPSSGCHTDADSIVNCKSFACNQCNFVGSTMVGLSMHRQRKHVYVKQKVRCPLCRRMILKNHLRIHQKIIHSNDIIPCSKCNFKGTRSDMLKHRRLEHDSWRHPRKNNYNCTICDLKYQSSFRLDRHMNRHRRKSNYGCKNCNTFFDNVWSLENHVSKKCKILGKKTLDCPFCDKTFHTQGYLDYHKRTNHRHLLSATEVLKPVVSLTCGPCGRIFWSSSRLSAHKRHCNRNIQLNGPIKFRSMRCRRCSVSFKTEIEFDLHMLKHRKRYSVSLHKCQFCYRSFCNKSWLTYHLRKNVCRNVSIPSNSFNDLASVLKVEDRDIKKCKPIQSRSFLRDADSSNHISQDKQTVKSGTSPSEGSEVEGHDESAHKKLAERKVTCSAAAAVKPSVNYNYSCDFCLKLFTTERSMTKHRKNNACRNKVPPRKPSSDPCPGCQERFESAQFLKRHMKYCILL